MLAVNTSNADGRATPNSVHHPLDVHDADVVEAVRTKTAPYKGALVGPLARSAYDPIFEAIAAADDVPYEQGLIAGIEGVWCRPAVAKTAAVILYLHGGAYVLGTAQAYRHFAGQFAARTQLPVFVAHCRLAPEHPCPAALEDAQARVPRTAGCGLPGDHRCGRFGGRRAESFPAVALARCHRIGWCQARCCRADVPLDRPGAHREGAGGQGHRGPHADPRHACR